MYAIIERSQRFLDRPLPVGPRGLLLVSAVLIFPTHVGSLRGEAALAPASWVPFALGVLALLYLRASVHGKVRDLVDVAMLSLYFGVFLLWHSPSDADFFRLITAGVLVVAALVMAWNRACAEDVAEARSAG